MKMPRFDDRGSRHVGFAPEPLYSRRPRSDEEYVMEHFHKHAKRCEQCNDPYSTHISGGTLCDHGHRLAQDVARYMYSKSGRAYSMLDREKLSQRVQVEIPPHCDKVRGLLRAVDHGLRVQMAQPPMSHDKNYYVPTRPDRRGHRDSYGIRPERSRRHRDVLDRYPDDRRHKYEPRYSYEDKYHRSDKRQSMPSNYAAYGSLREKDADERRKYRQRDFYDANPVYYYKPSKHGPEKRIPRSESPKRESLRRVLSEDYPSPKYEYSSKYRPSRYDYPESYRSSRYGSPDSYRSSRYGSPDSYQSSRQAKRSSWSPDRLYRGLFR